MAEGNKISVTILTKDSQRYIKEVLEALTQFDEVLVYDTGSKDKTLEYAKHFSNVRIVEGPFEGFGQTHNKASEEAKNSWILSIDSDEVIEERLTNYILHMNLDENSVYLINRKNLYRGKWIKGCGWSPDWQKRLYQKEKTQFNDHAVHENILNQGMRLVRLESGKVIHRPFQGLSDYMKKLRHYSELFAKQHYKKKKSSPIQAVLHGVWAFFKSYFLKRGFLQGYEGWWISVYNGHSALYKYLMLYEWNRWGPPS